MHGLAFRGKHACLLSGIRVGQMAVTTHYLYTLRFERGSVEVRDKPLVEALWQLVMRRQYIPGHRIVIEAHEDPADPLEVGAALRRLEALRHHLEGQSIEAQRIELQVHGKGCCQETKGVPAEFWWRAEIYLFPRVASLYPDVGDALLSEREVSGLEDARGATFHDVDANCKELEGQHPTVEWKRILGHASLRQWIEAGAYHPYFASGALI